MTQDKHYIQEPIIPYHADGENAQDQARRETYLKRLAAYLKDPEFRAIEGFPHGTDEAILALSDPPYYTACPNPFLPEILEAWQAERAAIREELGLPDDTQPGKQTYQREPFAADVSEGKNDPIYNAHSYHTKVPHKAIMRYILHYTDPGDIVFDGFCGTGMTGVAAQLCGDKKEVESLGYRVDAEGVIYEGDEAISRLGARKAVLNDLSPAATFIAYNYNTPVDAYAFEREAKRILKEVEAECGWMYETWHPHCDDPNRIKGKINYTVWSDVFRCPQCGEEMVFWDVAVDQKKNQIHKDWECPGCRSLLSKSPRKASGALKIERVFDTLFDVALGKTITQARQVPVLINYAVGKQRFNKNVDADDFALLEKIDISDIPYSYPIDKMPKGDKTSDPFKLGRTNLNHFYTKRNLWILATFQNKILYTDLFLKLKWILTGIDTISSRLLNFRVSGSGKPTPLKGTLYISSLYPELNPLRMFFNKYHLRLRNVVMRVNPGLTCLFTSDTKRSHFQVKAFYDYIFVDPPFGSNIMYSELNFLWESWLKVFTNNKPEAIINKEQKKKLADYQAIMESCFQEFYRLLKPGRWMTVEFHNSQNAVWNAIQEAILHAGFVVADVRALDKQQGSFNQVNATGAVKQDLIISSYKPTQKFEREFSLKGGTVQGAWDFLRQHLKQLPMPNKVGGRIEIQSERTPYLLYDRMLAFHLVRGLTIPLSAGEFYQGLSSGSFLMREGMAFTTAQAYDYDKLRVSADGVQQLALFVTDEASAIQWMRSQLDTETGNGPQTYAEIQPNFLKQLHQERYEALPELQVILRQNFLQDEEERWYIPDLARQADLDALKERALLHEFNEVVGGKGKIKVFRSDAIKAGFSKAWAEHDYDQILAVAERLPEQALQEDPKLKLYVDNARIRASKQPKQEQLL
jgi:DNA modification methylase